MSTVHRSPVLRVLSGRVVRHPPSRRLPGDFVRVKRRVLGSKPARVKS